MFHVQTSDICPCQIWILQTTLVSSRKLRAYTQERGTVYKLRPSSSAKNTLLISKLNSTVRNHISVGVEREVIKSNESYTITIINALPVSCNYNDNALFPQDQVTSDQGMEFVSHFFQSP
jgi:hypothetical protein